MLTNERIAPGTIAVTVSAARCLLWYVAQTADALDFMLCEIAQMNVDKLQKRYPNGFSEETSKNRIE